MLRITAAIRPEIEECVEALFGGTFFLDRPTPARLAVWRAKAQARAARQAGFAYAAYGHLKLFSIVEDTHSLLSRLGGTASPTKRAAYPTAIWNMLHEPGLHPVPNNANPGKSEESRVGKE